LGQNRTIGGHRWPDAVGLVSWM